MRYPSQPLIFSLSDPSPSLRPAELSLFSTSGCKRVAQKVDLVVEELQELQELEEISRTEL